MTGSSSAPACSFEVHYAERPEFDFGPEFDFTPEFNFATEQDDHHEFDSRQAPSPACLAYGKPAQTGPSYERCGVQAAPGARQWWFGGLAKYLFRFPCLMFLFLVTLTASYFTQFYFHVDVRAQLQPHEDFVFTANDARTVLASYHRRNLTDTGTPQWSVRI